MTSTRTTSGFYGGFSWEHSGQTKENSWSERDFRDGRENRFTMTRHHTTRWEINQHNEAHSFFGTQTERHLFQPVISPMSATNNTRLLPYEARLQKRKMEDNDVNNNEVAMADNEVTDRSSNQRRRFFYSQQRENFQEKSSVGLSEEAVDAETAVAAAALMALPMSVAQKEDQEKRSNKNKRSHEEANRYEAGSAGRWSRISAFQPYGEQDQTKSSNTLHPVLGAACKKPAPAAPLLVATNHNGSPTTSSPHPFAQNSKPAHSRIPVSVSPSPSNAAQHRRFHTPDSVVLTKPVATRLPLWCKTATDDSNQLNKNRVTVTIQQSPIVRPTLERKSVLASVSTDEQCPSTNKFPVVLELSNPSWNESSSDLSSGTAEEMTEACDCPSPTPENANQGHHRRHEEPRTVEAKTTGEEQVDLPERKDSMSQGEEQGGDSVAAVATYFSGCASLALAEDEDVLSPLHCFMRRYCVEAFTATEEDVALPRYGRAHGCKIEVGQVGIRCLHCRWRAPSDRAERAMCYPSSIRHIYHSIETWQRRHAVVCRDIPDWVRHRMADLMRYSRSCAGGRRQYWVDAAERLGMLDTNRGIRFIRDPSLPVPVPPETAATAEGGTGPSGAQTGAKSRKTLADSERFPLVEPDDRELVTDFLYLLMEQMQPCRFTEADRSGGRSKVKDYEVGYPGIECVHCFGKAGLGRYFPNSLESLILANSDRNIYNHMVKCRRCPPAVKEALRYHHHKHMALGSKNRRGSRKVFFSRVWKRLHSINAGGAGNEESQEIPQKCYPCENGIEP